MTAVKGRWRLASSRRRQIAVWAVLLGHAALWVLVSQPRRLPVGGGEVRRSLVLQLVPQPPRERAARTEKPQPAAAAPRQAPALPAAPDAGRPSAVGEGEPVGVATAAAPSPGPSASAPGALNLKPSPEVLRGALANPATTDPRSNSPKPTFEERIAMGLDPGLCVKLERDPEGVVRRRMGRLVNATSLLQASHGAGAMGVLVCE